MTLPTDPEAGPAYTRASVERYLRAAAVEQDRLQSAITDARARTEAAQQVQDHLESLGLGSEDRVRRDVAAASDGPLPFEVDTAQHALAATGSSDGSRP